MARACVIVMETYHAGNQMTSGECQTNRVVTGARTSIIVSSATTATPKAVRSRAEGARCMGNLRSLHTALSSYIQDHKSWPQEPEDLPRAAFSGWWINALSPYTDNPGVWLCPTMAREAGIGPENADDVISYTPAKNSRGQFQPHRWSRQPWMIEVGDYHGNGNHVLTRVPQFE